MDPSTCDGVNFDPYATRSGTHVRAGGIAPKVIASCAVWW